MSGPDQAVLVLYGGLNIVETVSHCFGVGEAFLVFQDFQLRVTLLTGTQACGLQFYPDLLSHFPGVAGEELVFRIFAWIS